MHTAFPILEENFLEAFERKMMTEFTIQSLIIAAPTTSDRASSQVAKPPFTRGDSLQTTCFAVVIGD
ncbi:hypothetical protein [Scytonema sp. UIC 10036]|uniref:hypothetical protein n=1 Tax=Scytonema sp. UIC 10036 TaxID=2304196 RepID=UPI001FA9C9B8|nr:hypothetical protein [Scytonema sp. UIC 10036]